MIKSKIFRKLNIKNGLIITMVIMLFLSSMVSAEDYSSDNFLLRDSVLTIAGGKSTSASFEYYSSLGQMTSGESISSSFTGLVGFLYFPVASTPIMSATAGNAQVNLSWTAAVGTLANISNYQLGIATVVGGPYTYESIGNTTSYTKSGLSNGTTYYFKIKAYAGTLDLVTSETVSAVPTTPITSTTSSGGGGGGSSATTVITPTAVNFFGRAYPGSVVVLLKDSQLAVRTVAGPDAIFSINLTGLSSGSYIFSVYGEDKSDRQSTLLNFPITITYGATTNVSGIFLAPTIAVDKSEVKKGDNIAIFGQSAPHTDVTIAVNSNEEFFNKVKTDSTGAYLYNFDSTLLEVGQHSTKSKGSLDNAISAFGKTVDFSVGIKNILVEGIPVVSKGDLSHDNKVNLVDFSIMAYWYKRVNPPVAVDLNGDNKIDLVDLSIMAYHWTG